jgi:hypothetical protein
LRALLATVAIHWLSLGLCRRYRTPSGSEWA